MRANQKPFLIYCHNIYTHTPHSGYHVVTEVAKTANRAKMGGKCINYIRAPATPPRINPMESGLGKTFSAQNENTNTLLIFDSKQKRVIFSTFWIPLPTPPTLFPEKLQKVDFK